MNRKWKNKISLITNLCIILILFWRNKQCFCGMVASIWAATRTKVIWKTENTSAILFKNKFKGQDVHWLPSTFPDFQKQKKGKEERTIREFISRTFHNLPLFMTTVVSLKEHSVNYNLIHNQRQVNDKAPL